MRSSENGTEELAGIRTSASGAEATTKEKWVLNENEWKWLVQNKGAWSEVKIPIRTNAPIDRSQDYVKFERNQPLSVHQEAYDKPIRRFIDALPYPKP
jgi:hypothetical protein